MNGDQKLTGEEAWQEEIALRNHLKVGAVGEFRFSKQIEKAYGDLQQALSICICMFYSC